MSIEELSHEIGVFLKLTTDKFLSILLNGESKANGGHVVLKNSKNKSRLTILSVFYEQTNR